MSSHIKILRYIIVNIYILIAYDASGQWITGNIDTITNNKSTNYAISPNSIAIDDHNTIHVVWQKRDVASIPESWRVYYSRKFVNGTWSIPIPISDTLQKSGYPSIVVASKLGKLFVTYVKSLNNFVSQISVAVADENLKWQSVNITNDSVQNTWPSIAIGERENVHIAWLGMDSLHVEKTKYSNNKSGVWKTFTLNDGNLGDNYYAVPSISISPDGLANILYVSVIGNLRRNIHAVNFDTAISQWKYDLLPEAINGSGILKISKKGKLNYVFNRTEGFQFPFKVYYTYKNNKADWTSPELIEDKFDGFCTSVEVDNEDNVHVCLDSLELAFKMGKAYYATNKSGTWKLSPISNEGETFFSCFKLGKNGLGHVIASTEESPDHSELVHFESANSLIGIHQIISDYFKDFFLSQNYPNPFNPSTTITFKIPRSQHVEISIHDVLGKKINTVTNKMFSSGIHNLKFQSSNIPSGIYFYKILTTNFSETKKLVILK